eukprot:TRINITY_DN30015_c0_g1_i1.p1 TRINITY_DN30015_c0_g1~~TRINITY_DN30015_c0_g1_i1.p1  ORF type:complete len:320 (+),score=58.91 TRINITY_DN30015_c0_g1_i1:50-1009(+)
MECQDGGDSLDIQSAFGRGKLGKALGYGTQGPRAQGFESEDGHSNPGFESEDANSNPGDRTRRRRHATENMMAAAPSAENKEFDHSRSDSCRQPSGQEPKPRLGQNNVSRPSSGTNELLTQALSEQLAGISRRDDADDKGVSCTLANEKLPDDNLPAKFQWDVSSSLCASLADSGIDACNLPGTTTFMIKSVPTAYSQRKLLQEFTSAGFDGLIDFFYLPKGPSTRINRGFAFCNLLDGPTAVRFYNCFHGNMLQYSKDTPLELTAAKIQGFEENAKHFLFEKLNNKSMDAYSRPLFLRPLPSRLQQRLSGSGGDRDKT